jgi:hypothetical protein
VVGALALAWFGVMPASALAQTARVVFRQPVSGVDFVRVYVGLQPRVYDMSVDLRSFQLGSMDTVAAMDPALSRLLTERRVYYVALTAVDAQRRESPFSNEVKLDRTLMPSSGGGTPTSGGTPTGGTMTGGGTPTQPMNTGPSVSVLANGQAPSNGVRVTSGQTVSFLARASDPDGLGFPLFQALGSTARISYSWNFGGGTAANSLEGFTPAPTVRFTLRPGEASRRFNVQLTVLDRLGAWTAVNVPVDVTPNMPPSVSLFANGAAAASGQAFMVRAGQPVALAAVASDPDGLGFPIFPGFPAIAYFWDGGGGTFDNALAIFSPSPIVRFALGASETQRTFRVTLSVLDKTGAISARELSFIVQR